MRDARDNCVVDLLDRERRPDGRAHRRLDHRGPGADAHRRRVPARCATRRSPCMRRVGVETGGANVQFAVDPRDGRMVVIEMNPRVSRSSALASKATGFPIAKIAALLAVGYTLDEIPNDITRDDAGRVRALDRLRGHEDPALRLREVPRRRLPARHAHEERRRGHGDRPHVQGVARQGAAVAGGRHGRVDRPSRCAGAGGDLGDAGLEVAVATPTAHRSTTSTPRSRAGGTPSASPRCPATTPGSSTRSCRSWSCAASAARPRDCSPTSTPQLLRQAKRARVRGRAPGAGPRVRRRTRCAHAATRPGCARCSRPSTPAPRSSRRTRRTTTPPTRRRPRSRLTGRADRDDPRQRPQPHRAGHRVRLLLRARRPRAARGRLRRP